jgi:hypothetical protein
VKFLSTSVQITPLSLFLGSRRPLRAEDPLLSGGTGEEMVFSGLARVGSAVDQQVIKSLEMRTYPCNITVRGRRSEPSNAAPCLGFPDPSSLFALQPQIDEASK